LFKNNATFILNKATFISQNIKKNKFICEGWKEKNCNKETFV